MSETQIQTQTQAQTEAQTEARKPASRHAVTFALALVLLDMVGFGLIIPVLPGLIREVGGVGLARASVVGGWMFATFSLMQFACGPLAGNLSDRYGRRPLMLLAVAGLGLDYLFQAFAPSILFLFIGRAIAGVCGSSYVIANAFIADVTAPEDRAKAFGMMGAAFGLGFVLGPALGGLLGEFGTRVPFFVAAAVSGLNLIYGYFVLPESLAPDKRRAFEWARANPFGAFRVFRSYPGVLPMCVVLFFFFFATSVYPAIWPFWGIAQFGWSPATIGLTLAAFGLIMAGFQGGLTGPVTKRFSARNVVLIGLISSVLAAFGYGLAGGLTMVVVMMLVHGPEGFVYPMITALLTKAVPEDAQGELQGGLSAITNLSMLMGTLFFAQIFGYFMREDAAVASPAVGFFVAGAGLLLVLGLFLWIVPKDADA